MNLLDFIFPKKCVWCGKFGAYICRDCLRKVEFVEHPVCPVCQRQAIGGRTHPGCSGAYKLDGLVVGLRYRGPVRAGVGKVKYRWLYDIAQTLVDLAAGEIWRFDLPQEYVLVPIPLHRKRKSWRGFNQAELLCEILARKFKVGWQNLLIRKLETKTQVGLSREERRENIKGAFQISQKSKVKGQKFILVDDVYTTGATMNEACGVLKRAGAKVVWGMVIALG